MPGHVLWMEGLGVTARGHSTHFVAALAVTLMESGLRSQLEYESYLIVLCFDLQSYEVTKRLSMATKTML